MNLLDKLERLLGRMAIAHLSLWLVIGQVFVLLSALLGLLDLGYFVLVPELARHGEWWRLITFVFMPPPMFGSGLLGYVFIAFAWYMFFLMGSALEGFWGEFRFNLFLLTGYALTAAAAFATPLAPSTNLFIAGSVFLAFAWLNPDFELVIFFILPVKIKWLALVTWMFNAYYLAVGSWPLRLQILASVGNFLVFFSRDIVRTIRHRQQSMTRQVRHIATAGDEPEPRHRCHTCGKTDLTDPRMDFRYCSKCAGDRCYCAEHIFAHEHVLTESDAAKT
jgi:hypothetical protein